jgi:uncharacterized protein (DUF305 family)
VRRALFAFAGLLLAVAGCGGSPAKAATPPNAEDVMFLQMMVPHHEQGIEIAKLAAGRPIRPELKELANAIVLTQGTEVEDMKRWLKEWGQPADANPDPGAHAAHGGMKMTDPAKVTTLQSASDAEFQQKFIAVLVGHQQGAVELAQAENSSNGGTYADARDLARRIIESRNAEVKQLLNYNNT